MLNIVFYSVVFIGFSFRVSLYRGAIPGFFICNEYKLQHLYHFFAEIFGSNATIVVSLHHKKRTKKQKP